MHLLFSYFLMQSIWLVFAEEQISLLDMSGCGHATVQHTSLHLKTWQLHLRRDFLRTQGVSCKARDFVPKQQLQRQQQHQGQQQQQSQ